jgi:predicted Na+-dependent transporter
MSHRRERALQICIRIQNLAEGIPPLANPLFPGYQRVIAVVAGATPAYAAT